jgi:DNA mismatch repair protein MutS
MRQVALIVLMASLGSFVPASHANISICDRIFTRVGASDDLASGQSTFMVEMNEVANILRNATTKSLLILDEIGRGTSTFDGLSIAWAVVEYIAKVVKAKTLFATHYHELTELEGKLDGVNNYCIAVTNHDQDIVFLRKIIPGGADQSYGIDVASLAGVPKPVIDRAKEISAELSDADIIATAKKIGSGEFSYVQESIGENLDPDRRDETKKPDVLEKVAEESADAGMKEAIQYLKSLDLNHMTPLDAINSLYELKERFKV